MKSRGPILKATAGELLLHTNTRAHSPEPTHAYPILISAIDMSNKILAQKLLSLIMPFSFYSLFSHNSAF